MSRKRLQLGNQKRKAVSGGVKTGGRGRDRRAGTKQSGDRTLDARGAALAASLGKPEEREEEREEQGRRTGWRRTRGGGPPVPERAPAPCPLPLLLSASQLPVRPVAKAWISVRSRHLRVQKPDPAVSGGS